MGVTQRKSGNWQARYSVNGKRKNLGTFPTKFDAQAAITYAKLNDPEVKSPLATTPVDYIETDNKPHRLNRRKPTLIERIKHAINNYRANAK